jgi:hypothetical protein
MLANESSKIDFYGSSNPWIQGFPHVRQVTPSSFHARDVSRGSLRPS